MSLLSVLAIIAACAVVVWGSIWFQELMDEQKEKDMKEIEKFFKNRREVYGYGERQYQCSEQAGKELGDMLELEDGTVIGGDE